VASKNPLRHFQKAGQEQAVFSMEVVDEQARLIWPGYMPDLAWLHA
jgi:hypothetical protein